MNVHQVMKCYQQTLDYYKVPAAMYFTSQKYAFSDRKNVNKLFYAFIELCPFPELFIAMVNKEDPTAVIERQIGALTDEWNKIVNEICEKK